MAPRSRQFDPDTALDAAMQVFWRQGYEATTIQDLVDEMGINRFSLYDTFGDKHRLFLDACRLYRSRMEDVRLHELEQSQTGLTAIRDFFYDAIETFDRPTGPYGCLMTQSVLELADHDEQLRDSAQAFLSRLEEALYKALRRARHKGELKRTASLRESATCLVTLAQGLSVMGKAFRDTKMLKRVTNQTLAAVAG